MLSDCREIHPESSSLRQLLPVQKDVMWENSFSHIAMSNGLCRVAKFCADDALAGPSLGH